jgi:hypothetical protein
MADCNPIALFEFCFRSILFPEFDVSSIIIFFLFSISIVEITIKSVGEVLPTDHDYIHVRMFSSIFYLYFFDAEENNV